MKDRDLIAELNQIAANEVDGAVLRRERRKWPLNIMGGGRQRIPCMTIEPGLRRAILTGQSEGSGEPLQGDDVQLEYYQDGYPKLPACLNRRRKPEPLAEAA